MATKLFDPGTDEQVTVRRIEHESVAGMFNMFGTTSIF